MAKQELNDMQRTFCELYVESGNGKQSAIGAGYSERSASSQASNMLNTPKIKKYIAKIRQEQGIDYVAEKEMVVEELIKMIQDPTTKPEHRLTAIDKLSRIQGWMKDNQTIEVNHNNMDKLSDEELERRMLELASNVVVPMKKKA